MSLKGVGYLYMVKLDDFRNCYKVGCTSDVTKRLTVLKSRFGNTTLVSSALFKDKQKHEQEVKRLLYPYCNRKTVADRMYERLPLGIADYPGGVTSEEHLVLEGANVYRAIQEFKNYIDTWAEV